MRAMGCIAGTSSRPATTNRSSRYTATTSPNTTKVPALPAGDGSGSTCHKRHSSAAGLAATRGGATTSDGAAARPVSANSLTSSATVAELRFIASTRARVAIEQVNSPVASMLRSESLRPVDANITIGGASLTALK